MAKFKGQLILNHFLKSPSLKIHIKELARKLNISSRTSHIYLNKYADEGLLRREKIANALIFSLNNESPLVKELKRTYVLFYLQQKKFIENILKENPEATSIVLYGSYASGEYDEKSDIDILIISHNKKIPKKTINSLRKETTVSVMSLNEWRKQSKTNFGKSVLRSHIILYGNDLVLI